MRKMRSYFHTDPTFSWHCIWSICHVALVVGCRPLDSSSVATLSQVLRRSWQITPYGGNEDTRMRQTVYRCSEARWGIFGIDQTMNWRCIPSKHLPFRNLPCVLSSFSMLSQVLRRSFLFASFGLFLPAAAFGLVPFSGPTVGVG